MSSAVFYVEDDDRYEAPWQIKLHYPGVLYNDVVIKKCSTHYEALNGANKANKSLIEDGIFK